jgi:hypothetical protein
MLRNLFANYGWAIGELIVLVLAIVELVALRRSMRRSREHKLAAGGQQERR